MLHTILFFVVRDIVGLLWLLLPVGLKPRWKDGCGQKQFGNKSECVHV